MVRMSDTKKINAEKEAAVADNDLPPIDLPTDWMPFVVGTENSSLQEERERERTKESAIGVCLTVGTFHRAKRL